MSAGSDARAGAGAGAGAAPDIDPLDGIELIVFDKDGTLIEYATIRFTTTGIDERVYPRNKLTIDGNEWEPSSSQIDQNNDGNPTLPTSVIYPTPSLATNDRGQIKFTTIDGTYTVLTDAGFQQGYTFNYMDTLDKGGQKAPEVSFVIYLSAYADAEGAADIFARLAEITGGKSARVGDEAQQTLAGRPRQDRPALRRPLEPAAADPEHRGVRRLGHAALGVDQDRLEAPRAVGGLVGQDVGQEVRRLHVAPLPAQVRVADRRHAGLQVGLVGPAHGVGRLFLVEAGGWAVTGHGGDVGVGATPGNLRGRAEPIVSGRNRRGCPT